MNFNEHLISKNEYNYYKSRIEDLEEAIFNFVMTNETYKMYEKYLRMSEVEKRELNAKWDQYYEDVKKTHIHSLMKQARLALEKGNKARLQEIVKEAKDYNTFLKKPSTEDPTFLEKKLEGFFESKKTLEKYKRAVLNFSDVYESKKNSLETI